MFLIIGQGSGYSVVRKQKISENVSPHTHSDHGLDNDLKLDMTDGSTCSEIGRWSIQALSYGIPSRYSNSNIFYKQHLFSVYLYMYVLHELLEVLLL